MSVKKGLHHCDFCGKTQKQVEKMIVGRPPQDGCICNECLEVCMSVILEENIELSAFRVMPKDVVDVLGFHPVFSGRRFEPKGGNAFYLGPFSQPFDDIYNAHVVPVFESCGLTVRRADEIFSTDAIMEDVWAGINSASLIVADVTGKNPNVMYEIGMAHTIGRPVLLISQSVDDLPFDIRHRRCVVYSYTPPGCRKLEDGIRKTIEYLRRNKEA
jgi:ClpX C4-type zinc finger